jgi:hypothetical protein
VISGNGTDRLEYFPKDTLVGGRFCTFLDEKLEPGIAIL